MHETLTFFSLLVYWQFNVTLITHFLENLFFNETHTVLHHEVADSYISIRFYRNVMNQLQDKLLNLRPSGVVTVGTLDDGP